MAKPNHIIRRGAVFALSVVVLLLAGCGRAEAPLAQVSEAFQVVSPAPAPPETSEPAATPGPTPELAPEVTATPTPAPTPVPPGDIPTEAVDSSCFSRVGYDGDTRTLVVVFLDSGRKYAYYDVPRDVYDTLMSAGSIGGYYDRAIKGAYDSERIG